MRRKRGGWRGVKAVGCEEGGEVMSGYNIVGGIS